MAEPTVVKHGTFGVAVALSAVLAAGVAAVVVAVLAYLAQPPTLMTVETGEYPSAPTAERGAGHVLLDGESCFTVDATLVQVQIRWRWITETPRTMARFYNEDGGTTPYGGDGIHLDDDGCFSFTGFRQRFPLSLVNDLARHPTYEGQMQLVFTLTPVDAETKEVGEVVFVTSGPFFVPPAITQGETHE